MPHHLGTLLPNRRYPNLQLTFQVFPAVPYGLGHDAGAIGQRRGWSQEGHNRAVAVAVSLL